MNFTYENEDRKVPLETYEWDNTWIDHAADVDRNRVLYIGDSISCGSRMVATELTEWKILFDGFGTSKAVDNPWFTDSVRIFAKQQRERTAVLFNNGLHGFHLDDETGYKEHYENIVRFLVEEFKETPVFIVLTTHIADEKREERVKIRNKVALEIAEKYSLPVIDLYSVSLENKHLLTADGVHFTPDGYKKLAGKIVETLQEKIPELK